MNCESPILIQSWRNRPQVYIWRVSSQNGLTPFWSIWDIWDLSCWNIKKNNKKICNTFDNNFKNIPLYIMRKVSLERYYFVLYDCALTSKMAKMVLKSFCDKTLHLVPIWNVQLHSCIAGLYTWPLRRQAAYEQPTRGPVALSPFQGTRQWA